MRPIQNSLRSRNDWAENKIKMALRRPTVYSSEHRTSKTYIDCQILWNLMFFVSNLTNFMNIKQKTLLTSDDESQIYTSISFSWIDCLITLHSNSSINIFFIHEGINLLILTNKSEQKINDFSANLLTAKKSKTDFVLWSIVFKKM